MVTATRADRILEAAIRWLADMHDEEECKFNGGDGCMSCLAQEELQAIAAEEKP